MIAGRRTGRCRSRPSAHPHRAIALVTAALLTAALALTGCGRSARPAPVPTRPAALGATIRYLATPIPKPDLTLTDTHGRPFNLRTGTAGKVTLLYFGYTHCPDVCPTTMADIAVALAQVGVLRGKVDVVFVTTDPHRDTPAVIKAWLGHFDASFIGLTGNEKTIYAAAAKVGVALVPPKPDARGDYAVSHGAQVTAFGAGGTAHVVFTEGTTPADYAHDLVGLAENTL